VSSCTPWIPRTVTPLAGREQKLLAVEVLDGYGIRRRPSSFPGKGTAEVTRRWTGQTWAPVHAYAWKEFITNAEQQTVWHLACHGWS
jgi:hypothetical protein